jgi:hypothetical protein
MGMYGVRVPWEMCIVLCQIRPRVNLACIRVRPTATGEPAHIAGHIACLAKYAVYWFTRAAVKASEWDRKR